MDQQNTYLKPYRSLQQLLDEGSTDSSSYFSSIKPTHIVSLALFIVVTFALIYLIKRNLIKFLGFFHFRKDYLRFQVLNQDVQPGNEIINKDCLESNENNFNHEKQQELSKKKKNSTTKMKEIQTNLKQNLIQGFLQFHTFFGLINSMVSKQVRVRLPRAIIVCIFLISLFINLTLSIALTSAVNSLCQNQRTFLNTLYKCKITGQQQEDQFDKKLGLSFIVSLLTCSLTLVTTFAFSRNYLKFMRNLMYPKFMKNICRSSLKGPFVSDPDQSAAYPIHMNEERVVSQESKKSSKGNIFESGALNYDNHLFKIQEMEDEEQHQSPSLIEKKQPFGEIQNVMRSSTNKNGKGILNQSRTSQEDKDENKDFHPYYESYENSFRKEQKEKSHNVSNFKNQKSLQNLNEQTTIMEGHVNLQNISVSRQLENIREEEFEGTYQNPGHTKEEVGYKDLSHSQSQDNSQLNFLSQNTEQALSRNKKKIKCLRTFTTVLTGFLLVLFVAGIFFNLYQMLNMTEQALKSAFLIFGLALVVDLIILRTLSVLTIAIYQSFRQKISYGNERKLRKETFDQVSKIYEEYEVHFEDYERVGQQSTIIHQEIEQEQLKLQKPQQRIQRPRQRSIGDVVIIEQSLFNQAPIQMIVNREQQNETNRNENDSHIIGTSMLGFKKQTTKGEKVEITNSISFRAEDNIFKKSHVVTKRDNYGDEESQYDIEEIPIYSARDKARDVEERRDSQEGRNLVLPGVQVHQFETPKPEQNSKGKWKDPRGSQFTQQIVTFNDEQDGKKSILRDIIGQLSGSKKGSPNKSEYQSLKKYLAAERQSSMDSIQEQHKFQSPSRKENSRSSQLLANKENTYNPQYNTLSKIQQNQKSSKSGCKKSQSKVFDVKNGSDEEKSLFSDLKNVNINSELEFKKYHSSKKVNHYSQAKFQQEEDMVSSTKKFDQENLNGKTSEVENVPNLSPFQTHKGLVLNRAEMSQNKGPIQQNSSMKNIPAFGSISKGGKTIIENMGYGDHHHSSLDLTQPVILRNGSPDGKNWGSVTKTVEDSIDNNVKQMLKGKKKNKQLNQDPSYLQQFGSINSNEFQESQESLRSKKSQFKLQKVPMVKKEKGKKSKKIQKKSTKGEKDESNKSKIYEDEQSTFRLVNFGQKQSSVQQLQQLNQMSSKGIDFYSNNQTLDPQFQNQNSKEGLQKISFIHIEESPEKSNKQDPPQQIYLKQGETSPSSNGSDLEPYGSRKGNLSKMMQGINQDDLIEAAHEAEDMREKYCSRQSIGKESKKKSSRKRTKSNKVRNSGESDSHIENSVPTTKRFNKPPKREDEETKIRIEEQKRKLSGFLKLAQQLKSSKDEEVIVELIEVIKDTKKPLPMAKINELKKLELMASPYNQSLISMIKDEYERFKKQGKQQSNAPRGSKSQQRSDFKSEAVVKHLSGIYGSINGTQLSNRKDKSMKASSMTREETTATRFTNVLSKNNRIKNVKSMAREHTREQPVQNDGVIRIIKKNTQMPIVGYQNAIDVNSSLSHVGITSEEEDITPSMKTNIRQMAMEEEEEPQEELNDRINN